VGLRRRIATRAFRFVARDHGCSALRTPGLTDADIGRRSGLDLTRIPRRYDVCSPAMSTMIRSQTTIGASPERVWAVLTDFASYPAWNPFVKSISGNLQLGSRLAVRIAPSGGNGMAFSPVVTELQDAVVLEWLGHLLVSGIFDGRHRFELARMTDGNTAFTQTETFSGILIPFLSATLKDTERGFAAFNEALKFRSEAARA
jgi:hypothetical protein